ncbi:glycosyltransferase family 4 protein [Burkholderia sp. LS-044]|uniref:glycosyltransferase family 4 protein n=1 Tax=Burkholderia sp. LS-044 TaxID=1459967 RepID=UPI0010A67E24|nr:glycosyltransferase family 4 protein [Burkholderia sp. LS-044]THJ53204.1 glycosyltransferase family 4 protein [Burkholderia sp. LS-044]
MKILYTNFHGGNGGGHDTYIYHLAAGLGRRYRVAVASPAGSRLSRMVDTLPGVRIVDMQFKPCWRTFLPELVRLRRLIQQSAFDIIHVNGSADHRQVMLALVGCRTRPSVVFTKHNTYAAGSIGNFLRARFATDTTIAVSDYVRLMLERQSPYGDITVIKHGVQLPPHTGGQAEIRRRRIGYFGEAGADAIVLGSVAGTGPHKGWSDLVSALAQLPDALRAKFRVLLAGDWPSKEQREFVAHCGVAANVAFVGPTDRTHDILATCDASFVLSYHESLSFACREAMSMGRAVIVTDVGGLPENVDDRIDGWIVPPRSPEAIAAVLREIAEHPERVPEMGRAARARSEREFSFARFTDETSSVYRASIRGTAVSA